MKLFFNGMHQLGTSSIFLFKMVILKKSGKIPRTSYSIFLVCLRFRTLQGRGSFSFLERHLMTMGTAVQVGCIF